MALYRDEAVVLRTHDLGEADRIITVLSRRHGKLRAVAKGVRRTKSRFGGRLEPFVRVDLMCYQGRSLDTVTQADILDPHASIARDYVRFTAGQAVLEATDRLSQEHEPTLRLYLLVVGALRALDEGTHAPSQVLDAFLLRALSVSGYEPALEDCARCGAPGPHRAFSIAVGGSVCPSCRPAGSASPSPASLLLLAALLSGDWSAAESADERTQREGSGLVAAYAEHHLERRLRSLAMVER